MPRIKLLALALLSSSLFGQTTIYMRTGAPRGVAVSSVASGTPAVVTTRTAHGYTAGDTIGIWGTCIGVAHDPASGRNNVNFIRKVASSPAVTSLTFGITDLAGTPITTTSASNDCSPSVFDVGSAAYTGKLTAVSLPTGPWGWLDGPTGPMTRRLALGTANGLTTLAVSAGVATVTTSYAHGVIPGDRVSVTGSGNANFDHGTGVSAGPYFPYTVATSADSTHFTFNVTSVPNGTYSNANNACGPAAVPNGLIGGTLDCLRISQVAYTGNPFWDGVVGISNAVAGSDYRFVADGGTIPQTPGSNTYPSQYGEAGMRFLVDQQNATMLAIPVYMAKHVELLSGVNWLCYAEGASCGFNIFDGNGDNFFDGISLVALVAMPYMSSADRQTFLDKLYNDVDDPAVTPATTTNVDFSNFRNNKTTRTNRIVAGGTTTVTLDASASGTNSTYNGQILYAYYSSNITSITTGTTTSVVTDADWGLQDDLTPGPGVATLFISGVTGTGTCTAMNGRWLIQYIQQRTNDKTHFILPLDTTGCTSPTGGATTTAPIGGSPVDGYTPMFGRISAYNGTTKAATFDAAFQNYGGSTATITTDMSYRIVQAISIDNNANGHVGSIITGFGTHFTTDVAVGDAVMGGNAWYGFAGYAANAECYVTAVTDDTHLVVTVNSPSVQEVADRIGTSSRTLWIARKWAIGDAGVNWVQKHWIASPGAQPVTYPAQGGDATGWNYGGVREPAVGSNNGILNAFAHMAMGITAAQYGDHRGVEDAARHETYGFDYELSHYMRYLTGPGHSGAYYSFGVIYGMGFLAEEMASIPGFPAMDWTWLMNTATWSQYSLYPDLNNTSSGGTFDPRTGTLMGYASETGNGAVLQPGNSAQGQLFAPIFSVAPTSDQAKYARHWLSNSTSLDMWTASAASSNYLEPRALIHNPNNIPSLDYKNQPLQFAFLKGSQATGCALTGWVCDPDISGNSVISRTSWSDRSAGLLYFGARTYAGDHDMPQNGDLWYYQVGGLLNGDAATGLYIGGKFDFTAHGGMPRFGNDSHLSPSPETLDSNGQPSFGKSPMTQWYSDNHGTWDTQYGDKDGNFVWSCANLIPAYVGITIDRARKCVAEFKDFSVNGNTGEHIFAQWDSIATTTTPMSVETHVHYVQNGQGTMGTISCCMSYTEGNTTCPGAGGCASINTNRAVQSLQDGSTDINNPMRQFGVLTHFLSPGTVTIRDDTPVLTPTVTKTVHANITTLTPGTFTTVLTAIPHGIVGINERVTIAGVSGTGTCNGSSYVRSIPDTTHFTLWLDTHTCSGPTGGTSTTATVWHFTGHNIYPLFNISSVTSTGSNTIIATATPTNFTFGTPVQIAGVTSTTNSCDTINQFLPGTTEAFFITSIIDSTHFTIGYNSSSCVGQTGGFVIPYNQNYSVNVVQASGTDWGTGWNSPLFEPSLVGIMDADNFSILNSPDTSGYTTTFNGVMQGEYVVNNTGSHLAGYGFSHRFSVCAGSCDSTSTGMESLIVHKVAQNLTDTTLTTTPLSPDANWYGVQTKDAVLMVPRNGGTPSTMAAFTSTHSGVGRYLFGGIAAGTYTVTRNGTAVAGSPFTVTSGSNAIAFETTAGTISLNGSGILPPTIVLSPTSMSFSCVAGGSAGSQALNISSTGNPLDQWSASKTQAFTSLSATSGTSAGSTNVGVSCAALTAGSYSDTVTVTSTTSGVTNSPQTVAISVTVSAPGSPVLTVSPGSLNFSCATGAIPASQTVTINASNVTLDNWTATKTQSWLTLSPTSGSAPATLTVSPSCASLAAGDYSDTISVASTTSGITNSPQTVAVSIHVTSGAAGVITASPSSLVFSCIFNGSDPVDQQITIAANNVTLDNWSASSALTYIALSPTLSSFAGNLNVSATCAGLSVGAHSGTISVASTTSGITNSPLTLGVTFNVSAAAAGAASATGGKARFGGRAVIH